jgi:carboxypeptidase Q
MKTSFSFRAIFALVSIQALLLPVALFAQQSPTRDEIYAAIRKEEADNSKIMHTEHILTDLYGPRLTGSPNHVNSAKWIKSELDSWGFSNTALEPWDFGHVGWENGRNTGVMLTPVTDTLTYEVLAWTPSTKGPVQADAVSIVIPTVPVPDNPRAVQQPTQAELDSWFAAIKPQVAGKMVLVGKPTFIDQSREPQPKHLNDEDLKKRLDPANQSVVGGPGTPTNRPNFTPPTPRPGALTAVQVRDQLDKFLIDNGVLVRINESQLDRGAVRAFSNSTYDITRVVPTVVMRNEDFGRIYRLLIDKTPVKLEFDLRSRIIPDGVTSYNVVGELPGTDKKDEVIMLGGHLDSWHSSTGATDNAIGCATMMEAARILKAIHAPLRRTVRVACWSGEEEGLLGSQAYVKQHFGSVESPKADFGKLDAYFNIDDGTGRARGMSIFGPPEAATVLREALAPFSDLGFMGVISNKSRRLGGTDSTSFSVGGLAGVNALQDPIEYTNVTWHTNLDTYERIIEPDVRASAVIFAAAVYTLANRDEMLPRFAAADMPAPTPAPSPSPTPAATPRP